MEALEKGIKVHPACVNAENPFHECSEYCFRVIAEKRAALEQSDDGHATQPLPVGEPKPRLEESEDKEAQDGGEESMDSEAYAKLSDRQKKFYDLRMKLNAARKANQSAIVAERKREETPQETRGISKKKWFEEKQKRMGKELSSNGLDMKQAYMLETQEGAEEKYKVWEKKPAAFGWDVFNQRSLYRAYKKRTNNVPYTMDDYAKAKDTDPEFYRNGASLQYGKAPDIPEENVDRMVAELSERAQSRKNFSRRRKFHEEKDIDSINDRNEHFNRKIERAFGKYTVEIKNNLERGTALPD